MTRSYFVYVLSSFEPKARKREYSDFCQGRQDFHLSVTY